MPSRHPQHRPRRYANSVEHTFATDVIIELVMLSSSIMFVVGSCCFFSFVSERVLEAGEVLFIIASVAYVTVGTFEMWELVTAHSGLAGNSSFHEQMAYFCAAIIFMVGTILYWPHIYRGHQRAEEIGEELAAWCFIVGSLGFVIASFWNAVSMSQPEHHLGLAEVGKKRYWLTVWALFCSLIGGVFFVTGSYLFRLNFKRKLCKDVFPDELVPGSAPVWCVGITDQGTIMFIIGSLFYLSQSVLNMIKLCIPTNKEDRSYAPVPGGNSSDSEEANLASNHDGDDSPDEETPATTNRWC